MSDNSTDFLDLDAIASAAPVITIKLADVRHVLVPVSVEAWIANMKAVKALGAAETDIDTEINTVIEMVIRSFPTLTLEDLRKLPLTTLNKVLEFARQHNGEKIADAEVKTEQANPPVAPAVASDPSTSDSSSVA